MTLFRLPVRNIRLPFMLGGRPVYSRHLPVAIRDIPLTEALGGAERDSFSLQGVPDQCAGSLLCNVPDPGWRSHTVYADRIACVLLRDTWHYLSLGGGFDDFMAHRYSEKSREAFARDEARLAASCGGRLDLQVFASRDGGMEAFHQAVEQIRQACTFPEAVFPVAERRRRGEAEQGYVLRADGVPVASLRLICAGDVLLYAGSEERDDFRAAGAGQILHLRVIRSLFEVGGYRYLDFRPGDGELKRQFANGALRSAVVLNLRPTLANRVWAAAFMANRRAQAGAEGAVGRMRGQGGRLALRGA